MTRWWWVRHGPTHEKALTGWRDVPADLSDRAKIQRLSAYLPQNAVLIASDLHRARATAQAISIGREPLITDPRLREFNFGLWDGLHFSEVAARDPILSRQYWEEPGDIAPPMGESWNEVATRVGTCVDALHHQHPNRDIIAVAHMGVILTQIQRATGSTAYQALAQQIESLSVTQLTWSTAGWHTGAINHCP